MTESSLTNLTCSSSQDVNARLISLLDLHLHQEHGSLYWLQREEQLGINIKDVVRTIKDLPKLGLTNLSDLATQSVWDFLPRAFRKKRQHCIVGESGGTTGRPTATVFTEADFHAAFIAPFLSVAELTDFPIATEWLWVGPSGPHIIGKVVRELTKHLGSPDPWSVDFDPRWVKKTPPDSFAAKRYLAHVIDQVMFLLDRESPEVLFTTPPVLTALAEKLSDERRAMFKGIHYGGMTISAEEINRFKTLYPNAVHLSGYGNSMCGVALEIEDKQRTTIDYYPHSNRLIYDVVQLEDTDQTEWQSVEVEQQGRVMFHRLDESTFLPNVLERDVATLIEPANITVKPNWTLNGLRDPGPPLDQNQKLKIGLY